MIPRMVKKLLHTRMRVNDLERTVKFYEEALGLRVGRRHTSPRGAQLAFIRTPNSDEEIEICQLPDSPPVRSSPTSCTWRSRWTTSRRSGGLARRATS
jgi:lactoylglutathione lyase